MKKTYPYEYNFKTVVKQALAIGSFVFLFLYIFDPFGNKVDETPIINQFWTCFSYGLLTFVIETLYEGLIPQIFSSTFNKPRLQLYIFIIFIAGLLATIGLANALLYSFTNDWHLTFIGIIKFQFYTVAIGIFPVIFYVVIDQNWRLKKYLIEAQNLNQSLHQTNLNPKPDTGQTLVLTSENEKEILRLHYSDLLFIKSAGNYIEVVIKENKQIRTQLLRSSIKRIEMSVKENPNIFRCHRTYLVNLVNIQKVAGDSQGYQIEFRDTKLTVPVSRSYLKQFKESILNIGSLN